MDEQSVTTSTTQPVSLIAATKIVAPPHPAPSAIYLIDFETKPQTPWSDQADHAASLGFDAILLASPFAAEGVPSDFTICDHNLLHETLGGGDAAQALRALADHIHASDQSLMLEICLDRIAESAPLVARHPDWFAHAQPGVAFCFLSDADAAVEWWDQRIAAWQAIGVGGFRCEAAHRVPATVWRRLIEAAKQRDPACCFIATTFGASPSAVAGLAGSGFDHAMSSSCFWDAQSSASPPWIADDCARIGAIAGIAALAAPPARLTAPANAALGLAGFLGNVWVLNARLDPSQSERVIAINRLRRSHRARFARNAAIVSPPGEPVTVLTRLAVEERGLIFALGPPAQPLAAAKLRSWIGDACGPIELPEQANALMTDSDGTLLLLSQPPRPIQRRAIGQMTAKTAAKAPRIAIEAVTPAVDAGRFPVKRTVGTQIQVEADLICDGHGKLAADLLWRAADQTEWQRTPMALIVNDRWGSGFQLERVGRVQYTIEAWIDRFGAFIEEIGKKHAAGMPIALELIEGTRLVEAAAGAATQADREALTGLLGMINAAAPDQRLPLLTDPATVALMRATEMRHALLRLDPLPIDAERGRAGFASWYEIFPRSQSGSETSHGDFEDVIAQLPRIRAMGFDVLYFPPIHPIGRKNRKGRNNSLTPSETDPGSPYAIGSPEGGHCTIHPELGGFDDFRRLLGAAADHGIEIALDFAIQCAPDHPWLREHPEWFDWRPDGTIRYAENPPKKYEDIVNVDFYAEAAMPALWVALRDVVAFWVKQGVRIFRVDNPHTKPLPFWEWLIADIRGRNPDVMFLAEAFTRPKLMYRLAKLGFSQSYTYFTWRNTAAELRNYLTELTTTAPREFFCPHFFVNTPDINPVFLHGSGRAGFLIRAALAATLSGLWGVYNGFELCEAAALPGREEYADSEKYQIRAWDHHRPGNIVAEITALNHIRRGNQALHSHLGINFLPCSNERVLYFEKFDPDRSNVLLIAISVDPFNTQIAEIELPLWRFGLDDDAALDAEDLARGVAFVWHGKRQVVSLNPQELPYCIWRVHA